MKTKSFLAYQLTIKVEASVGVSKRDSREMHHTSPFHYSLQLHSKRR